MTNKDQLTIRALLEEIRMLGVEYETWTIHATDEKMEEALKTIESLMLEVIGEDRGRPYGKPSEWGEAQDALRAEQRERAKQLIGKE